jgi:hypothetical protein
MFNFCVLVFDLFNVLVKSGQVCRAKILYGFTEQDKTMLTDAGGLLPIIRGQV